MLVVELPLAAVLGGLVVAPVLVQELGLALVLRPAVVPVLVALAQVLVALAQVLGLALGLVVAASPRQ
ncbi:unnamed protein product [marine sediment metagenome]|uniref:Uncharacterized protein n=1 Tax=marine sediment metagenome TaxID=412755 RepID=X1PHM6_9ZZZZ